jgi:RNA polymerase sigma-70 factor (ECF subfamily)
MADRAEDFADLLARARRQDREALAQLVRQYESKIRLVARVLLGPALRPYLDSVDLVQSVHHSLMLGMRDDRFDISSPDQLVALALTMVRRKAARHWRRMRRQQRLDGTGGESENLPQVLLSLHGTEPDPAGAAQLNDTLRHLCNNLDATEKRILELRSQGYNTAEIAAEVGLAHTALRVRMTRLRQRLRASGVLDEWV